MVLAGQSILGTLPTVLIAGGYVAGFVVWMLMPSAQPPWSKIRVPFFVVLALFVAHKVEERQFGFFPALSQLTGDPIPTTVTAAGAALYALAAAWLLMPLLIKRHLQFGYLLAWTFFVAMGVVELAHFAFPLMTGEPYGYFPGMATVAVLSPAAWWGLARMWSRPLSATDR